jgi:hypothetical protein
VRDGREIANGVADRRDRAAEGGAGLAGLAAALHLAGRGRVVTVVERETVPGGRAGPLDCDGYLMDTGPTVLTMPDIVEHTLAAVGESLPGWLELTRLDPAYHAMFADGSALEVHTDARPTSLDTDAMALTVAGPQRPGPGCTGVTATRNGSVGCTRTGRARAGASQRAAAGRLHSSRSCCGGSSRGRLLRGTSHGVLLQEQRTYLPINRCLFRFKLSKE